MPCKDPEQKKEWERQHRTQRLARRRELRELQEVRQMDQKGAVRTVGSPFGTLGLALVGGGALAAYSPPLAVGAGSLVLLAAASYKKDWSWWLVGLVIVALAIFSIWSDRKEKK